MLFSWLRKRRRKKILAKPINPQWLDMIARLPFFERLSADERNRLTDLTRIFVAEKHWEGCGGLELTEEVQVLIAAQACLLILNLEHNYYKEVLSIYIYPSAYKNPQKNHRADGTVSEGTANLGEAWRRGPVILAWDAAKQGGLCDKDGKNLVFHEFAHKLDFLNDYSAGTPPQKSQKAYARWQRIMTEGYKKLIDNSKEGRATLLDKYGTTNEAEFFAVSTECFFEKSKQLERRHPELYDLFCDYYGQDPAERKRQHK